MSTASLYNSFGTYPLSTQELQINKIILPDKIEENSEDDDYVRSKLLAFSDIIEKLLGSSIEENDPSLIQKTLSKIKSFSITIINERDVSDYLIKNQDIIDILPLVAKSIKKHAGDEVQIYMQTYEEYYADYKYILMLFRLRNYNDKNILEMIHNISKEYQKELAGKSGDILVTTDFIISE